MLNFMKPGSLWCVSNRWIRIRIGLYKEDALPNPWRFHRQLAPRLLVVRWTLVAEIGNRHLLVRLRLRDAPVGNSLVRPSAFASKSPPFSYVRQSAQPVLSPSFAQTLPKLPSLVAFESTGAYDKINPFK